MSEWSTVHGRQSTDESGFRFVNDSNLNLKPPEIFMITRIVRMHFRASEVDVFLKIFEENKVAIRNFPGCTRLELMKDANQENTFTTLSHWNSAADLEEYRKSELFKGVWVRVKALFSENPQAFSLDKFIEL
jgi:quinol monooxygenase YgiN